jgi:hypothetical protein
MGANNLRIIYQNAVDLPSTTLTASTTLNTSTTPVTSLASDIKGKVWKSAGAASAAAATISAVFSVATTVGGIIIPFCNFTSSATFTVNLFSAANFTGSITAITATTCCPYQTLNLWNWASNPSGASAYAYGGGTYARLWIPSQPTNVLSMQIIITDSTNTYNFEASRLIIGPYWSPTYNTTYGLSVTMKDFTTSERTEAGDLVSNRGPRANSMSFTLPLLNAVDRKELNKIMRGNGSAKPLFISLFPSDTDIDREGMHQIYGKLSQLPAIAYPILDYYSTQIDIEEI